MKVLRDILAAAIWPDGFTPSIYFDRASAVSKFTDINNLSKIRIIQFIESGDKPSDNSTFASEQRYDVYIWANASFDDMTDEQHDTFINDVLQPYKQVLYDSILSNRKYFAVNVADRAYNRPQIDSEIIIKYNSGSKNPLNAFCSCIKINGLTLKKYKTCQTIAD